MTAGCGCVCSECLREKGTHLVCGFGCRLPNRRTLGTWETPEAYRHGFVDGLSASMKDVAARFSTERTDLFVACRGLALYAFPGGWRCKLCMVKVESDEDGNHPEPYPHHESCVLHDAGADRSPHPIPDRSEKGESK